MKSMQNKTKIVDCELIDLNPIISYQSKDLNIVEEYVDTGFGNILVAQQGAKLIPNSSQCCIVTFHDLGLNYLSNFQAFFNYQRMRPVMNRMPVFHINAPGQEDNAEDLPNDYIYPSMDELADSVRTVCNYYSIKQAICIGVGIGANVMARVAKRNPDIVDGLFLINPVPTTAGWYEWAHQKRNIYYLNNIITNPAHTPKVCAEDIYYKQAFPQTVIDYLIWHHFGTPMEERSLDLNSMYKSYFSSCRIRPRNLALLIDSYLKRTDIGVERKTDEIECSSLVLCGNDSPYLEDSVNMNQRLNPEKSTWMKLYDCGMPLDERPDKVSEAFILFVQGLGLGLLTCYKYK